MAEPKAKIEDEAPEEETPPTEIVRNETEEVPSEVDWYSLLEDDSDDDVPSFEDVTEDPVSGATSDSNDGEVTEPVSRRGAEAPPQEGAEVVEQAPQERGAPETASTPEAPVEPQKAAWTEEQLADARKKYTDRLKGRYAMSAEQGDNLLKAVHENLPTLMAELHQSVVEEVWAMMRDFVPKATAQTLTQRETRTRLEDQFFKAWPKLVSHKDTVARLANAYRQMNPKATVEQAIQEVGAQAHIALKIPLDETPKVTEAPAKPFVPERNAGGVRPPAPPRQLNPYEQLAEEFLQEDEGF